MQKTDFILQPGNLSNDVVKLTPLQEADFETLFAVAADPLIWQQHPTPTRYQKDVFKLFFRGAIESKGAFLVVDSITLEPVGSSRFYDVDEENSSVKIGYSFLARKCWGRQHNRAMKTLMITHAFTYVDAVIFEIGASNFRSQKAIEKLGAVKIGEAPVTYAGEPQANLNFIYQISKNGWAGAL